jgi:hypothetical protein
MAYKTVTLDDALLAEIEAWAARPDQNRSLSNAVETLCKMALASMKKGDKDVR